MKTFLARGLRGSVTKPFFIFAGATGIVAMAGLSMPAATREAVLAPAIAAAQSLSSIIGNRSPGSRAEGALAKSKKRMAKPKKRLVQRVPVVPDTGVRRRLAPRGPEPLRIFDEEIFARDIPMDAFPSPEFARVEDVGPDFTVPNPRAGSPFILIASPSGGSTSSGGGIGAGSSSGGTGSTGGSTGGTSSTSSSGGTSSGGSSSDGISSTSSGSSTGGSMGGSSTSSGGSGGTSSTGGGSTGGISSTGGGGTSTGGTIDPPPPGPVPEPGTWMMMIAGFGMIGTMLRRRPRAARATT